MEDARGRTEGLLSVVVITRNERDRIGACLDSIFEACREIDDFEVVLVDSRSTDGTVDVAREYPITVLRLPDGPTATAGAGRYVGTEATGGDLVLFVDGDMVLTEGWLRDACRRVREDPDLGGLDGHLDESMADADRPVAAVRGVALYDRTALVDAGGFDPFLLSNEDIDLSYRVAAEGYRLVRLPTVVASHPAVGGLRDRVRRWRNGYYRGRGQLVRKYASTPSLLARLLRRHWLYYAIAAWFALGAAAGTSSRRRRIWATGTVLGAVGASLAKSPAWTADRVGNTALFVAGIASGVRDGLPDPEEYPLDAVEVLQTGPRDDRADRRASPLP